MAGDTKRTAVSSYAQRAEIEHLLKQEKCRGDTW